MSIEHPTATDLWSARTAVSITVAQAHTRQADADRDLVEALTREAVEMVAELDGLTAENAALTAENAALTAERDRAEVERLTSELAMSVAIVTQLDIENQRLNAENDELRRMCEIVERIQGERDRARDLAVRAGAFEVSGPVVSDDRWAAFEMIYADNERLTAELHAVTGERDQAIYERDSARAASNGR